MNKLDAGQLAPNISLMISSSEGPGSVKAVVTQPFALFGLVAGLMALRRLPLVAAS